MSDDENIKSDIKEIDLGTILSLKQQQDKIAELENHVKSDFKRVEDHMIRNLKLCEKNLIMIEVLERLIKSQQELLNNMGTVQDFTNIVERIKKLEKKLDEWIEGQILDREKDDVLEQRIEKLEKKESRNYDNINELRRQISVNDDQIEKLEGTDDSMVYHPYEGTLKEGEKSVVREGNALRGGSKQSINTDSTPSCNHEWEFRDPENIGHSMAFCKKCGYLRGSKEPTDDPTPEELLLDFEEWQVKLLEKLIPYIGGMKLNG